MSELLVSRTHIDALLTAALRWSESYESWHQLTVSGETSTLDAPDSWTTVVVNAESVGHPSLPLHDEAAGHGHFPAS
ncbi:hypothetical protein ACIQAD_17510 [Streptomyces sp. NPDC088551]|uniref:hypothetical protein n=1 Tax=Streptomyces sp. NPDC088551 TaxID=3365863 RepID=UPI0038252D3E